MTSLSLLPSAAAVRDALPAGPYDARVVKVVPLAVVIPAFGTRHEWLAGVIPGGMAPTVGEQVVVLVTDSSVVWVLPAVGVPAVPTVTTLPTTPADGDEVYYQTTAMAADGVLWHLRYRAAAAGAYKWEYVGGSRLAAQTDASVSLTTLVAFTDLGVSVTLPLAGDYDVEYGAGLSHTGINQGVFIQPVATGLASGTPAAYAEFTQAASSNGALVDINARYRATGISGTLSLQYFVGATGGSAIRRKIAATPVRVG